MAYFPDLPTVQTTTVMTDAFLGINKGLSIADGEFADMQNLTADAYPVLSTRRKRMRVNWKGGENGHKLVNPQGLVGTEKMVVIDDGKVYLDGEETGLTLSTENDMQPKHVVCMGAYVCVWPDKKYINTANPDEYGDMGASWSAGDGDISAIMCRKDGTDYDMESIVIADEAPPEPEDGKLWLDTSGDNDVLKQYSEIYDEWVQVATTYIKIQAEGIGRQFREGDAVFLSGVSVAGGTAIGGDGDKPGFSGEQTLNFTTDDFTLKSTFTTTKNADGTIVNSRPTTAERTKTINVSGIPEGAAIKSAVLHVKTTNPAHGYQVLTVNGQKLVIGDNAVPVEVSGNGEASFKFVFQVWAHGTEIGSHSGVVGFSEIELEVTYDAPEEGATGSRVDENTRSQMEALNNSNMLYGVGDDYIIVAGLLRQHVALAATLKAEMRIPDFDYVCEANNRIWGCTYSRTNGELVNEIHACALGDFRNWYLFEGTSMDSYVVSIGSDGVFTGAFSLKGNPLFFKENVMHRISGTQPSNFALNSTQCRGVQDGCWRSMTQVNETLFYKARTDVMAYDGSLPVSVSEKLGDTRYYDASAGSVRDKYYISMRDKDQNWNLFVFDTRKGLWHREDASNAQLFATMHGDMYCVIDGELVCVNGSGGDPEGSFEWSATFGVYGYETEAQKYLSRFNIRAQLDADAWMKMEIMYDSDGEWVDEGTVRCPMRRTFMIPVIPRRCDHCQIRLSGKGAATIYSIARVLEIGGDG